MTNKTYNGWTNHATWLANLWLGDSFEEEAQEIAERHGSIRDYYALVDLAAVIEDYVNEFMPELTGLAGDLLQSALNDINYDELAEAALRDIKIEEEDEEDDEDEEDEEDEDES